MAVEKARRWTAHCTGLLVVVLGASWQAVEAAGGAAAYIRMVVWRSRGTGVAHHIGTDVVLRV